jgi:iron complex transport system substrate-binding protein
VKEGKTMSHARIADLSRRGFLAAGGAIGLAAVAAACGGKSDDKATAAPKTGGPWSFTDDRNQTAKAATPPKNIVAYVGTAAALYDFGVRDQIKGIFGPAKQANGKPDPLAGSLPVNSLASVGSAWGEFSIEKYAALKPELLVTHMFLPNSLWYVPDASKTKILALAPAAGISVADTPLTHPIEKYAALAASLGADPNAGTVVAAKQRFEKAVRSLQAAVKANPGVKVMAGSAAQNLFYVSKPSVYADLNYYVQLGVNFIVPDKVDSDGFFEDLSWENADKYKADVILLDSRTSALQPKDLTGKPAWARLPAVKAGQITPWLSEPIFSYQGVAPVIETLATAIQNAKKVS